MEKVQKFLKYLGISLLMLMLYAYLSIISGRVFSAQIKSNSFWRSNLFGILSELLVFIVFFLIYYKDLVKDFKDFKKNYKKILDVSFKNWLLGLIIMFITNIILNRFTGSIATNEEFNRHMLLKTPLYAITAMILIAPILEELVFRLAPKKAFTKNVPYIIYSALLFGGLHILASKSLIEVLYIIPYGALGAAFAKNVADTNNIFSSITTHMIHNAIAVSLAYITLLG